MHLKDFLFSVANFVILFGALFLITRKMIVRMFKERKEKIIHELEESARAEENSLAIKTQVKLEQEQARQQEEDLLANTRQKVEENSAASAESSQEQANVLRRNAQERERQLRAIMHGEVSAQVLRQVAEETAKALQKDEFAPQRIALVDEFIQKTIKA